jgi:hypothetical protein
MLDQFGDDSLREGMRHQPDFELLVALRRDRPLGATSIAPR